MSTEDVLELVKDCQEVQRFLGLTDRPSVKTFLNNEIKRLEGKIAAKSTQPETKVDGQGDSGSENTKSEVTTKETESSSIKSQKPKSSLGVATSKITSYGWDQSEKYVKLYINVTGVKSLPAENVNVEYTTRSFRLVVKKLNSTAELFINRLFEDINPEKSHHKVKADEIVLFLCKAQQHKWEFLKTSEQKAKETKTPKFDDKKDPSAGIMEMMKNMYDEGDDDMKRMIAKAWTEGREKGGMPGM